jgi:U32 family peptidase
VESKNRFAVGDRLELIQPAGTREVVLDRIENAEGEPLDCIKGGDHRAWLCLPADAVGAFVARFLA